MKRSQIKEAKSLVPLLALTLGLFLAPGATAQTDDRLPAATEQSVAEEAKPESTDPKQPYKDQAIQHYNRGHDLHQQGFFNQAIAEYKLALAADERMEEAHTNIGLIYAAQRNYTKAMEAFKKSLQLNPNRPNALNGLGTVLYAKNKFAEAMEKWKEAVKIDPRFASAYYNMGNALENEKDFRGAVEAYANALGVNGNMADAYYRIGSIYAKQRHPAQASILLTKAIQLEPAAEFVHDAKKTLTSLEGEFANGGAPEEPEVKMNIMAPPTGESSKTGS